MKLVEEICKQNSIPVEKHWRILPTIRSYVFNLIVTFLLNWILFKPKVSDLVIIPIVVFLVQIVLKMIRKPKDYKFTWL